MVNEQIMANEALLHALNEPRSETGRKSYSLNKIRYRESNSKTTTEVSHVYDIKDPFEVKNCRNPATLKGRTGGRIYAEVILDQREDG
jgi:hypothetical protein